MSGHADTGLMPVPFPMPTYAVGTWVMTEQVCEDFTGEHDDRPQWYFHPALVCGLVWSPRHREWEYYLCYPQSPCSWLPDGYVDPTPTIEGSLYPCGTVGLPTLTTPQGPQLPTPTPTDPHPQRWVLGGALTNGATGNPTLQQQHPTPNTQHPTAA